MDETMNVPSKDAESSFDVRLSQLRDLHDSDKHLAAARLLQSLQSDISEALSSTSPHLQSAAQSAQETLSTPFFKHLAAECAEVLTLRQSLNEKSDDWILSYSGSETRVWYRREPNTASHTILTEGEIRAPLLNVAALIYEADLYDRLFWYVTSATELPLPGSSWLKRVAHISVYAPWPLYKRDVTVYAFAVDALDDDDECVLVVSRSLKYTDGVDEKEIPAPPRTVRVDMTKSGFEMKPTGPGVVKARFLYNVNPHLSFVPMALINWVARTLCRWSLRTLESRARDLSKMPKEYQERLDTKPVYQHIRNRLNEFWESKGISQDAAQAEENEAVKKHRRSLSFDPDVTPSGPSAAVVKQLVQAEGNSSLASISSVKKSFSRLFTSS